MQHRTFPPFAGPDTIRWYDPVELEEIPDDWLAGVPGVRTLTAGD